MLKTNEDKLVKIAVIGEVSQPMLMPLGYNIGADGVARTVPGVGGITYNKRVGDPCVDLAADHVEPGVSMRKGDDPGHRSNAALNFLACVGNEATVVSGDAKGKKGVVTGMHGGVEHVLVDFPEAVMEKMCIGDKIQIRAYGMGLELSDFPGVKVMNCDPGLLNKWKIRAVPGERLEVPVAKIVPARVMGSGLGSVTCHKGDYDIQMFDEDTVKEFGLDSLRFGDFVAITDADHTYGRIYKKGAVSVGIVVHSASDEAGHGPGVTTLLASPDGVLAPVLDPKANLADILGLRRKPAKKKPAAKKR